MTKKARYRAIGTSIVALLAVLAFLIAQRREIGGELCDQNGGLFLARIDTVVCNDGVVIEVPEDE